MRRSSILNLVNLSKNTVANPHKVERLIDNVAEVAKAFDKLIATGNFDNAAYYRVKKIQEGFQESSQALLKNSKNLEILSDNLTVSISEIIL